MPGTLNQSAMGRPGSIAKDPPENISADGQKVQPVNLDELNEGIHRAVIAAGIKNPSDLGSFETPTVEQVHGRLALVEAKLAMIIQRYFRNEDWSGIL